MMMFQAWNLYESNRGLDLVDPKLNSFNEEEAKKMLGIALLCTQASPMMRPSMSRVVVMLTGDAEVSTVTSKPSYLTDWQFNDMSSFVCEDGTSGSLTSKTSNTQYHSSSNASLTSKTSNGQYHSSSNASVVYDGVLSPRPMLHDVSAEGR